jgi:transcriptional regulator with AAA-type ATPase domain
MARVDERIIGDHIRYQLTWLRYTGALRIAEGRYGEALEPLEQALEMGKRTPAHDDMTVELWRLRAEALLGLGRADEALPCARQAIQACRGSDRFDHPAGLRVEGRCLAALGRTEEAKASLAAALADLVNTEFHVERRRLHRDMEKLGMHRPAVGKPPKRPRVPSRSQTYRISLRTAGTDASDGELLSAFAAPGSRLPSRGERTGKERVARLLHELSSSERPFVVVDCTTLSETLAEAELFGVARGAYTGAASDRLGLVGAAHGGTLLIDELPQLSLSAQSKLLRLLQEGTYRRLGEARTRSVAIRVVATTNQDTQGLLASGALKPDLFFRLHGHRFRLRPLRERPQDIALLAEEFAAAEGLAGIRPDAMTKLTLCAWPGNARQLEMLVRVAASELGRDRWLEEPVVARLLEDAPQLPGRSAERARLKLALDQQCGNVAATARALGMSRQVLYKALHRHGLI